MGYRKIVITSCSFCPAYTHSGSYTPGGAYPMCANAYAPPEQYEETGRKWTNRILPWEPGKNVLERPCRSYTGEIPDWCPLPEDA